MDIIEKYPDLTSEQAVQALQNAFDPNFTKKFKKGK